MIFAYFTFFLFTHLVINSLEQRTMKNTAVLRLTKDLNRSILESQNANMQLHEKLQKKTIKRRQFNRSKVKELKYFKVRNREIFMMCMSKPMIENVPYTVLHVVRF